MALDTKVNIYTNNPVQQAIPGVPHVVLPVNLQVSTTFPKGTAIGESTGTAGLFAPWIGISNVALTSNVATVTTAAAHGLVVGQAVTVAAVTATTVNGAVTVASVPSTTTFTYAKTASNVSSAADTGNVYTTATPLGNPTAVLEYTCVTDASGNITFGGAASDPAGVTYKSAPAIFSGFVKASEIPGLDALLVTKLGKLIKGTVSTGILKIA